MSDIKTVNIYKRGNKYYVDYVDHDHVRVRRSVGSDYRTAQNIKRMFDQWLLEGRDPLKEYQSLHQSISSLSLRDFFPEFMDRHVCHLSGNTQKSYRNNWNQVLRFKFCTFPLQDITKKIIYSYQAARIKEGAIKDYLHIHEGGELDTTT